MANTRKQPSANSMLFTATQAEQTVGALMEAYPRYMKSLRFEEAAECLVRIDELATNKKAVREHALIIRREIKRRIRENPDNPMANNWFKSLKLVYRVTAPYWFEDFCVYTEWERDPREQFYIPRQQALKPLTMALQRLADGELDLLGISLPPGVGKTALALFFLAWMGGRSPGKAILCGSHSASILRGMYEELLRELDPEGEYLFRDVFPGVDLARTNAQDMKIDLEKPKRFATYQFASIGSDLAGKVRAQQLLYCDDLVASGEEALNAELMEKKWRQYTTDYLQRTQGDTKELHIATRWSVNDVLGRLKLKHENNPRALFIEVPALNEDGESNFDYDLGYNHEVKVGFSTERYMALKETMDEMAWNALYMQQPVEREALLYESKTLTRFYELPEGEPDGVLAVVDTAEGGGDFTVMPVFAIYGSRHFLIDAVCSDALPEITDELIADALIRNKVQQCQFESNAAGGRTADKISDMVRSRGGKCRITKHRTTTNKLTKIIVNSAWIKANCLFFDEKCYPSSAYKNFMRQMTSFTQNGKAKHDDVPDALAQYALYTDSLIGNVVQVTRRPF